MNRIPTARDLALTDLSMIVRPPMARYRASGGRDLARRLRAVLALVVLAASSAPLSAALAQPAQLGPATPPVQQPTTKVKPRHPATPGGVKSACTADYRAHCAGDEIAGTARDACLRQNWVSLSATCRASLQHKSSSESDDDEP